VKRVVFSFVLFSCSPHLPRCSRCCRAAQEAKASEQIRAGENADNSVSADECVFCSLGKGVVRSAPPEAPRQPNSLFLACPTASMSTPAVPGKSSYQHLFGTYTYKGEPYRDRAKVGRASCIFWSTLQRSLRFSFLTDVPSV
jgi:hypothetical protein